MTKKDFEFIAQTLRNLRPLPRLDDTYSKGAQDQWGVTVRRFASELEEENPRFDCNRFIDACYK